MHQDEYKTLVALLAERNKWRAAYYRACLQDVGDDDEDQANSKAEAYYRIQTAEQDIQYQAAKILGEDQRSNLDRLLGYDFEQSTPWNVGEWASGDNPVEGGRVPVLPYLLAGDFVDACGTVVVRSISGFHSGDVLMRSGFHPQAFRYRHPDKYLVPHMLWQLGTGEWIGIDGVSVGYGGHGPGYAEKALRSAGLSEPVAARIVDSRFCDVSALDTADPAWDTSARWPVEPRQMPELREDGTLVVHTGERLDSLSTSHGLRLKDNAPDPDESGFYPSTHEVDSVTAWFNFLDQSPEALPSWARGERTISFLLDDHSAGEHGYVKGGSRNGSRVQSFPSVVVVQGAVQVWGHYYHRDQLRPLDPQVRELAASAGYTGEVPFVEGEPYTFFEKVGRFFKPEREYTGVRTALVKEAE